MLAVVATAKEFGVRPSELLAIEDPVVSLSFDLAAAVRLHRETEEESGETVSRTYL
ncbi:hypothetical protein LCGC14_1665380 [marine sediment metagenome]|uniref:Uncharacterized protein n=1 Tax=marine sediment metagenome TaxID=412755 RepID=A0A0F9HSR8_9ZZZZ